MALESIPSNRIQKKTFRNTVFHEWRRNLPFFIAFCLTCIFLLILPNTLMLINDHLYPYDHTPTIEEQYAYDADSSTAEIGGADEPGSVSEEPTLLYDVPTYSYRFGISVASVIFFPMMAFLLALLQFYYLTNKRAMDVYGALPIKREMFAAAKITAGLLLLLIPTVLSYLILLLVNLFTVGFSIYLIYEFLAVIFFSFILMLIPYSLVVFVSSLSGTITENIIYPAVFLFSPILIYTLVMQIIQMSIVGYAGSLLYRSVVGFLFPYASFFLNPYQMIGGGVADYYLQNRPYQSDLTFFSLLKEELLYTEIWLIFSIILLVAGVLCLKHRKNERAGQKRASSILNVCSCFLTSIAAGVLLLAILTAIDSKGNLLYDSRYVLTIVATILAFVIYQLVVLQSVSAMLRTWKQYLASFAVSAFFIAFLVTNAFGIYLQVPDVNQVESVTIDYTGPSGIFSYPDYTFSQYPQVTTDNKEMIDIITQYQQAVLDDQDAIYQAEKDFYGTSVVLNYKMKDGSTMSRSYRTPTKHSEQVLLSLTEQADFIKECNYAFKLDFLQFDVITLMDPYKSRITELSSETFDLTRFQQALQTDILAEKWNDYLNPNGKELGIVSLEVIPENGTPTPQIYNLTILIKPHYTNTIAYLESCGLMEYFAPDYQNIEQVALVSSYSKSDTESPLPDYYGNIDSTLSLFTKPVINGSIIDPENYAELEEYFFSKESVNYFNEPDKIQSILEDSYNQHEYTDNSSIVYVKTGYALTELILP
jgi:hypothetical protein